MHILTVLTPELVLFSRLSCFLCNTKKRITIKIYALIHVLLKTSAALTGTARVKLLQLY